MTESKELNWYFTEFVKTLIVLSIPADEQIAAYGEGDIGFELYQDFKNYYTDFKKEYLKNQQILSVHKEQLDQLEELLIAKDKAYYESNDNLQKDKHWNTIRVQAKKCLKCLNMDHLGVEASIVNDSSVEEDGTEVIFQIVQLDLVEKTKKDGEK